MYKNIRKKLSILVLTILITTATLTSNFVVSANEIPLTYFISVEDHITGEYLLKPFRMESEYNEHSIYLENGIKESLNKNDIPYEMPFYMDQTNWDMGFILKSVGNLSNTEDAGKWFIYVDNNLLEDNEFLDSLDVYNESVIRLIYNTQDSYEDMNALINKLATINIVERPDLETIYQEGLTILLNNGNFEDYLIRLDAAINPVINVDSIEIIDDNLSIFANTTHQLNYKVLPENHTEDVTFTSSDESVATIDENGIIQAISKGDTTITVHAGDITESIELTVKEIKAESITFDESSIQLNVGSQLSLNPTIQPSNATSSPTYEIKNDGVLKLEHNRIIALKE